MRVLHGPVNVGNQPWVLSRNERALGVSSDLVVKHGTWLHYPADRYLSESTNGVLSRWDNLKCAYFGLTAPLHYDVLHYYFGRSYLGQPGAPLTRHFLDLRLARRLGRTIFMTLQGCDVRQSGLNSGRNAITMCHVGQCQVAATCRASIDRDRRELIDNILPLCNRVFALNPDLINDVPNAHFLPYASVDVESFQPIWPRTDGPMRILHAPSDESIKGSRFILEAIERLKTRWDIELILVKKLPYEEALKRYASADLVIDQLLAGWYGGFAVEMMAMGKPVACYIRKSDLAHVPEAMRRALPLLNVSIPTLEADLEALLMRLREWNEWGRRSREFVLTWHHPRRIANAMVRAYRDPAAPFQLDLATEEATRCAA